MRTISFPLVAITMYADATSANECDAVLIPTISSFENHTRTSLDTLSVIQNNTDQNSSAHNF
jgi:hypothetical protein